MLQDNNNTSITGSLQKHPVISSAPEPSEKQSIPADFAAQLQAVLMTLENSNLGENTSTSITSIPAPEVSPSYVYNSNLLGFISQDTFAHSDALHLLEVLAEIEVELKKLNRTGMQLEKIEAFKLFQTAATKLQEAAKLSLASNLTGAICSLGSGLLACKMCGILGPKHNPLNSTKSSMSRISKRSLDDVSKGVKHQDNSHRSRATDNQAKQTSSNVTTLERTQPHIVTNKTANTSDVNSSTANTNNNSNTVPTTPQRAESIASTNSTSTTSSSSNPNINPMKMLDTARYVQTMFESLGRIASAVPAFYAESAKADQAKLEALAQLKNVMGSNDEMYCSNNTDTINKAMAQVGSIIDSSTESSKSIVRA